MRQILAKGRERVRAWVRYVWGTLCVLFLSAFLVGGVVKFVASEYVTMGYNDYLAEHHENIDFTKLQDAAKEKQNSVSK